MYSLTIKTKKSILKNYFSDEYDFSENKYFDNDVIEIYMCSETGHIIDSLTKLLNDNPMEYVWFETHCTDLYNYSGEHYYEQKDGIVKQWVDTSAIDDIVESLGGYE